MDPLLTADQLRPVLVDLADVIDGITPDRLASPTPCRELDVSALRKHVVSWIGNFAGGFSDPGGRAPAAGSAPEAADGATVRREAGRLDAAVRAGAAERPLYLGENPMPGDMAVSMILWEYLVHGWDLAVATGQPWQPADEAARAALEFAPGMLTPDFQGLGKTFGPRVPVDPEANAFQQLLGLSGRDPAWSSEHSPSADRAGR